MCVWSKKSMNNQILWLRIFFSRQYNNKFQVIRGRCEEMKKRLTHRNHVNVVAIESENFIYFINILFISPYASPITF